MTTLVICLGFALSVIILEQGLKNNDPIIFGIGAVIGIGALGLFAASCYTDGHVYTFKRKGVGEVSCTDQRLKIEPENYSEETLKELNQMALWCPGR